MKKRLVGAMVCYALVALAAWMTLSGLIRIAVWVFLGGMAAKTWIAYYSQS
jgi:hypothetical protein